MTQPQAVKVNVVRRPDFRESYANSVQMRVNLWDFYLEFGTVSQTQADQVNIETFQGVYLSPQQAKALLNVLQQTSANTRPPLAKSNSTPRQEWVSYSDDASSIPRAAIACFAAALAF